MGIIYENDGRTPPQPRNTDAMQEFMADLDESTSTDGDISVENPPYNWYTGYLAHPPAAK